MSQDILLTLDVAGARRTLRLPNIGMLDNLARFLRYPYTARNDSSPTVVDCGSCMGAFILATKEFLPKSRVIGFEPYSPCWPYLDNNLRGLKDVTVHRFALGDRPGQADIGRPDDAVVDIGQTSVYGRLENPERVEVRRLDDVVNEPVHIMKIDVEGAELDVLRGAERILAESQPLLFIELKDKNQNRAGHQVQDVARFLKARNYGQVGQAVYGDMLFGYLQNTPDHKPLVAQAELEQPGAW